jgi:Asp-tRNA(Asn)/Glu-tRNA(Gln) amidotransferase A subunit family amidase
MMTNPLIQSALLSDDAAQVREGSLSFAEMLAKYEARFEAIEPQIQAFIPEPNRFQRLAQEAQELERRYPDPNQRPPLYGALVGIKDIFHVDGFVTRAGTNVPPEHFAGAEAAVVTRLKQAGALIAGKTVTTEFAFFEPGPTRNPHNLNHTPGGSSSGSAAAVAAGLVHLATGTQTVGSVIRPAAYCGVVGYKPSFDRIDTNGLVYYSRSIDHVGLFTQDVSGMRLVASVLVNDWNSILPRTIPRILAVPEGAYLQQATALDAFEAQVQRLAEAGYEIKRIPVFEDIAELTELHNDLIAAELAQEHATWFEEQIAHYRPRTIEMIRRGQGVSAERLQQGRDNRLKLREQVHQLMRDHSIDMWICPAAPDVATEGIQSTGNPAMNMPWTHAGLPAITIPAATGAKGLPLGLQICAAYGNDGHLFTWAGEIARIIG